MKLWLVTQTINDGYDTYDSAVVASYSEEGARRVPVGGEDRFGRGTWAQPEHLRVRLVGEAVAGTHEGEVICASFNAG